MMEPPRDTSRFSATDRYGLLLRVFLEAVDLWRSYASPIQHPAFVTQAGSSPGMRRDKFYAASLGISALTFVAVAWAASVTIAALIAGIAVYRAIDILVALSRIAVVGAFGTVPAHRLDRIKIMRNTLAVLINYVELVFWYGTIYLALGAAHRTEFSQAPITSALALILSFTTLTTIGYGNIAPQGMTSAIVCWAQALTAVVLLSCVIGSLVSLAAAGSDRGANSIDLPSEQIELLHEPAHLPSSAVVWALQRVAVLAGFVGIAYTLLS